MRSDNLNKNMKLNRFFAKPWVILLRFILIDIFLIAIISYVITSIGNIGEYIQDGENPQKYFGLLNCIPKISMFTKQQRLLFLLGTFCLLIFNAVDFYKTRVSFSESEINQGQYGTRRWTTIKEIKKQFKAVPLKTGQFDGKPGFPISRIKDKIYIDDILTNCLALGSTRSGKGQGSIIQDVDIASRANDIKNRPSLIIADPKTENSRMMARQLEKRGYITRFLNLDEPSHSMGYNPLKLVIDYYKEGQKQKAQMAAKSFSFSIFNASDNVGQEPIWKHTATDLFTALQIAITSDLVDMDTKLNFTRQQLFSRKKAAYSSLPERDKEIARNKYYEAVKQFEERELLYIKSATLNMIKGAKYNSSSGVMFTKEDEKKLNDIKDAFCEKVTRQGRKEDISYFEGCFINEINKTFKDAIIIPEREDIEDIEEKSPIEDPIVAAFIQEIPEDAAFFAVTPNERKINAFSCISFFQNMCNRAASETIDTGEFEQKAETAMDEYFNQRPETDYARSLYLEIKSAGSKTKGSVYINMQSALSTFVLHDVAQMTAESDFDIESLGYGDKPVAVFMVIPSEDRSNHFIATTFIAQVYRYLFELAKRRSGKLDRQVIFILDEFGNLPPVENFAGMVTVGLGMSLGFHIYIQSYGQIYGKYKDDAQSILDNFATQQYIMSIGNDSAEEFSKKVGQTTVVSTQRSGGRFSTNKTYTESVQQRPLVYEHELAALREGESVIIRNLKRTDNIGVAALSMPIINEYKDDLSVAEYLKILSGFVKERIIKGKVKILRSGTKATLIQEWKIRENEAKRYLGTASLYAYQYLTDEFPLPESVDFYDINRESRKHINIEKRVYSVEEALEKIKEKKGSSESVTDMEAYISEMAADIFKEENEENGKTKTFGELKKHRQIITELEKRLEEYGGLRTMNITKQTNVDDVRAAIEESDKLSTAAKKYITAMMKEEGD